MHTFSHLTTTITDQLVVDATAGVVLTQSHVVLLITIIMVFRQTDYMNSCLFNSGRAAAIPMPPQYVASGHEYVTLQAYFNRSYYAMLLPPVPKDCPTPMGISGL